MHKKQFRKARELPVAKRDAQSRLEELKKSRPLPAPDSDDKQLQLQRVLRRAGHLQGSVPELQAPARRLQAELGRGHPRADRGEGRLAAGGAGAEGARPERVQRKQEGDLRLARRLRYYLTGGAVLMYQVASESTNRGTK